MELGVQAVEVGFAGASDMDFEACERLAEIAPDNVVVSALARAVKYDIEKAAEYYEMAIKMKSTDGIREAARRRGGIRARLRPRAAWQRCAA